MEIENEANMINRHEAERLELSRQQLLQKDNILKYKLSLIALYT